MRKASGYLAILFSIAMLLLATAGANFAWADPPGNNGTVKIINDRGDSQDDPDNDPHVCIFHIYGFNFDANQSGTWDIAAWPPGGGPLAATQSHGNWKAGADGKFDGHPTPQPFPDGHYKLTVNTGMGDGKQKVFWVRCASSSGAGQPSGNGSGNSNGNSSGNSNGGSTGPSTGGSTGVSAGVSTGTSAGSAGGITAVAGVQTSPTAVAGVQNLPSTSTDPTVPLGGLGIALMALGAALLSRRPAQA